MVSISGKRLILRDVQTYDLSDLERWLRGNQVWKKLNAPYYPAQTDQEVASLVENLRQRIATNNWPSPRSRLIIADKAQNLLMGLVSWYWISEETQWPAVGIVLYDPANWGKGYGYEALGMWSAYLFQEFPQFVRLDLRTWSGNKGMMRLAKKLGYTQEACFRQAHIVDGQYYDGLGYGILREEWETRHKDGFQS